MSISCQIPSLFIHDVDDCFIPLHENGSKWTVAHSGAPSLALRKWNASQEKRTARQSRDQVLLCWIRNCSPYCIFSKRMRARRVESFLYPLRAACWWDLGCAKECHKPWCRPHVARCFCESLRHTVLWLSSPLVTEIQVSPQQVNLS